MSLWALPHERNGAKCPVCQRPVYWTGDGSGWKDRDGQGSHRQPSPRGSAW